MSSSVTNTDYTRPDAWKDIPLSDYHAMLTTAENAARAAGEIIVPNLGCCAHWNTVDSDTTISTKNPEQVERKTNVKDVVTQYDKMAQTALQSIIMKDFPNHSFLGEEDVDPGSAASAKALENVLSEDQFVWIVDPIGTSIYVYIRIVCVCM